MAVLALGLLLGSSLELHDDLDGVAGIVLADAAEFDSGAQGGVPLKGAKGVSDKSGGGGDKLELPQGLLAGPPPLRLHCAGSEPPEGPLARRPAVPQSERLLRPPNA